MTTLESIAPAFVDMAHRIVWAVVGTTRPDGTPATRVLHPVWEFDGTSLTGWIATSPLSPKAADLAHSPHLSVTYWAANQDTCTADCDVSWDTSPEDRAAGWNRFKEAPAPVGYDPAIIGGWDTPESPTFGIIRLRPRYLRVMPGTMITAGSGELQTWRAPS
jgi:hypothetical protein